MRAGLILSLGLGLGWPMAGLAQQVDNRPVGSQDTLQLAPQVLTIDLDRMFNESLFGEASRQQQAEAAAELRAENDRIFAELSAEESSLAERRPDMAVEDFRAEAESFDQRVQQIRLEQDAKSRVVQQMLDEGQERFNAEAQSVLAQILVEHGALVMLYHTSVYLAVNTIDITNEGIVAMNLAMAAAEASE